MNRSGFQNQTVLVTGAAQGIGQSVARTLAAGGATVALMDVNEKGLRRLEAELAAAGLPVAVYRADVSHAKQAEAAVDRIERELGPIHGLVNVAGVLRTGSIETFQSEDWNAIFSVNCTGVFHMCRAVVRHMIPRRSGSIVTVSSNAARVPRMQMAAYAASKAAATHFTRCLGLEVAPYRIRCNVVSPGSTDTLMLRSMWQAEPAEDDAAKVIAGTPEQYRLGIPLGRIAEPDDIADAVLFLLSDRSKHITMEDLCVDGGATLGV
ncbi:2,3-dihydro-2,3-dihydroxybenzoate dehydrogenase [Gorillibacterium sp. sgz5001074]|uniref:2,3-dihydro-2,3-dihydroxybenzoate dehydrogenase n=1 Tax=Gorillibacterium sp. sgz5001074 TaxID=3446695 RepID=UPI003F6659E6